MLGDIFYSVGSLAGTAIATVEHRMDPGSGNGTESYGDGPESVPERAPTSADVGPGSDGTGGAGSTGDGELFVDAVIGSVTAWLVAKLLRPRSVSWPRVVVGGIGATLLSDLVGRALEPPSEERDEAYSDDPDALLVRFGAGLAMAAGYAALLYPRLPGSPLTRGLIFGGMELAAAPHGGLVRVATDTPGLKFPLKDLAVPIDEDAGPLARVAFGVGLGLLYRPDFGDDDEVLEHDNVVDHDEAED